MAKYELSISADYVAGWGKVEAIRELFQNALDEEVSDPDNKMFFSYDESSEELCIGNKNSTLEIQTLLIGNTTKHDDKFIGQHGEGYKLATIILLREGCKVTFNNYNTREIWTTRLVKSRRYNGALVPTFFVEKVPFWSPVPSNSLLIKIEGITSNDYEAIVESNLHLQGDIKCEESKYGRILLDEEYKGNIYVSGLFVCNNKSIKYGYDIKPNHIKLDRDRRIVSDMDLHWTSSKILGGIRDMELIKECVKHNDGRFLQYNTDTSSRSDVVSTVADDFFEEYGDDAIPVSNNDEFNRYTSSGHRAIMTTETRKVLVKSSSTYKEPDVKDEDSLLNRIERWYKKLRGTSDYPQRHITDFEVLLDELREVL